MQEKVAHMNRVKCNLKKKKKKKKNRPQHMTLETQVLIDTDNTVKTQPSTILEIHLMTSFIYPGSTLFKMD
jgi:hypothetical protein